MDWDLARTAVRELITGTDLNTAKSNYRFFIGNTARGVKVQIGRVVKIEITDVVLKSCFDALKMPQGYNTLYFQKEFPNLFKAHGCHVHAIGQLFVKAGLARESKEGYFLK